ncbi:MAG TPA: hypothetical protein VIO83_10240 [Pseudomonas sp.]
MNEKLFFLASKKRSTNHILHLILTLLTFGVWVIVWVIVASNNSSYNSRIDAEMGRIISYKEKGLSDVQAYQQIRADKTKESQDRAKTVMVVFGVIVLFVILGSLGVTP